MTIPGFDFGSNWKAYSRSMLNEDRLNEATTDLIALVGAEALQGATFLDIGCGSGLHSLAAARAGAVRVDGFDVNPNSIECSLENRARFQEELPDEVVPHFELKDVLQDTEIIKLPEYDIVYSWGVLHHTGNMLAAMRNAASRVNPEKGMLVLALYNRHWTSPIWAKIKAFYNACPRLVKMLLNWIFVPIMFVGAAISTRSNPLKKQRGMHFYYDVVDWIGGYPYEYASIEEVKGWVEPWGFELIHTVPTQGWTGCNELVFRKR